MKTIATTLCIVHKHPKILLGMKKRGFGMGKWNGFGGKVEIETIEDNIKREIKEECGIEIGKMEKIGVVDFEFQGDPQIIQVHLFRANDFSGEPRETEEMRPQWFNVDEIPFAEMLPDEVFWMPLFLRGKKFKGKFLFGDSNDILKRELEEVKEL